MVPLKLLIFLIVGTGGMFVPIFIMCRRYRIHIWKCFVISALLTVSGTIGTYLMYFLENHRWGGLSFYGAVFLVPLAFRMVAPILRIPYHDAIDLCAIGECIMLAFMKIHCRISGCCEGRILFIMKTGNVIRFPSQIVELIGALIIFMILMRWLFKNEKRGSLYMWYLILYGSTRFTLNFFRDAWKDWPKTIPYGTIWSMVAVIVGIVWLTLFIRNRNSLHARSLGENE